MAVEESKLAQSYAQLSCDTTSQVEPGDSLLLEEEELEDARHERLVLRWRRRSRRRSSTIGTTTTTTIVRNPRRRSNSYWSPASESSLHPLSSKPQKRQRSYSDGMSASPPPLLQASCSSMWEDDQEEDFQHQSRESSSSSNSDSFHCWNNTNTQPTIQKQHQEREQQNMARYILLFLLHRCLLDTLVVVVAIGFHILENTAYHVGHNRLLHWTGERVVEGAAMLVRYSGLYPQQRKQPKKQKSPGQKRSSSQKVPLRDVLRKQRFRPRIATNTTSSTTPPTPTRRRLWSLPRRE